MPGLGFRRPSRRPPSPYGVRRWAVPAGFSNTIESARPDGVVAKAPVSGHTRVAGTLSTITGTRYRVTVTAHAPGVATDVRMFARSSADGQGSTIATSGNFANTPTRLTTDFVATSTESSLLFAANDTSGTKDLIVTDLQVEIATTQQSIRAYGDSTAVGAGSTITWSQNLSAAYSPTRTVTRNAQGGENTTQLLARVAGDAEEYRHWTTIFMDYPNGGESLDTWLGNIKSAIAYLRTNRWYVHPPVQDVPNTNKASIADIQAALLSDPFFAGHTLSASAQAAYATEMSAADTRSDGLHDSNTGAVIRANYIKAFLDAAGW